MTTIPGKTSINFACRGKVVRENERIYYVFGQEFGVKHAIMIPASTHSLSLTFQETATNSFLTWCGAYRNASAAIWTGRTTSNSVTIHCLQ
jgi:hypothetical protein